MLGDSICCSYFTGKTLLPEPTPAPQDSRCLCVFWFLYYSLFWLLSLSNEKKKYPGKMAGRDLSILENFMKGWSFVSREQSTHTGCPADVIPCDFVSKVQGPRIFCRTQPMSCSLMAQNSTVSHWKLWKSGIWNWFFWVKVQTFTHRTTPSRGSGQLPSLCSLNSFLNAPWFLLHTSLVASWFSGRIASLCIGPSLLPPSLRALTLVLKPTKIIQDNLSFSGSI